MARSKQHPNQLAIDFLAAYRRMLISLGTPDKLVYNESMFARLTDQWDQSHVLPVDVLFQKLPVEAVVYRMQKTDDRLQFPDTMMAGELRGVDGLTGFSGLFRDQGWIMLPAELTGMYKNLFLAILTASIGLEKLYASRQELLAEAERVALATLLPEADIRNFFGLRLTKFPDSFRSEVSGYFNLPFDFILKRAYHLGAVSAEVFDEAGNTRKLRTTSRTVQHRAA